MAEQESKLSAFELAQASVVQAYAAHELAFELDTLLDAMGEPEEPPKWVFPLRRMAQRACEAADIAHTAALRVRGSLERDAA